MGIHSRPGMLVCPLFLALVPAVLTEGMLVCGVPEVHTVGASVELDGVVLAVMGRELRCVAIAIVIAVPTGLEADVRGFVNSQIEII